VMSYDLCGYQYIFIEEKPTRVKSSSNRLDIHIKNISDT
jgi:hypothetical protein